MASRLGTTAKLIAFGTLKERTVTRFEPGQRARASRLARVGTTIAAATVCSVIRSSVEMWLPMTVAAAVERGNCVFRNMGRCPPPSPGDPRTRSRA
jgi:hypothetical protein